MFISKIGEAVYEIGFKDWNRRLFDELIPLPDGTTYNAYLIKGSEKTALIDTVDTGKEEFLLKKLAALKIDRLDYLISNHSEQDHSGSIEAVLKKYPEAKLICSKKGQEVLSAHFTIDQDRFKVVADNETLSLGNLTLQFIMAPWVHWPETMLTYLIEEEILFPCDLFGSHLAQSGLFLSDYEHTYRSAKRYYAEIMMPFRQQIKGYLEKISKLPLKYIAPSHGVVYQEPRFILDAYRDWTSERVKNEVVLLYVSMHHSVAAFVTELISELEKKRIRVMPFNLTVSDIGEIAMALVDAATVLIATPALLGGAHPQIVSVTYLFNALRPKTKFLGIINSYGWGARVVEQLSSMLTAVKPEILPALVFKGIPREHTFQQAAELAELIFRKHQETGIVE